MGNTHSTAADTHPLETASSSRAKLHTAFTQEAKKTLSNVDLIALSTALFGKIAKLNDTLPYSQLLAKLHLDPILADERANLLYILLKKLAHWPCLSTAVVHDNNDGDHVFSLSELITLVAIFNNKAFQRIGLQDEYFIHLIFILLINIQNNNDNNNDNNTIDLIFANNKIKWNLLPIVQSFDQLEDPPISKSCLEIFLKIILPLSVHHLNSNSFNLNYNTQIKAIISTLFLSNDQTDIHKEFLPFDTFQSNYNHYCPHLFHPLQKLFSPLLSESKQYNIEMNYKILNLPLLSQLGTILDIDNLNMTINSKPLYQGSKDGYSINSIQSHTLNYRASTLLLISGKIIDSNDHFNNTFFSKFPKFHPLLNSHTHFKKKEKFQIAVFITDPWRITNTKTFGSKGFQIIQLSPFQIVLNSNNSIKHDFAYFSNIGLGLGFGSKPPTKSKDIKNHNINFTTGGVSLTIDNSLEMGNFRIEDMSLQSSTYITNNHVLNKELFNDIWFKINEIEIFGFGNLQSLKDQKLAMEWEERESEKRRGLGNKEYHEGRALLELAGIIGGGQSGGSM